MLRLRQIAIVARELEPVVQQLQTSLGLEVAFSDPAVATFGLHNAVLPVGNQFIEVVAPTEDGTAAGRYLDRRNGDGGYMVILQSDHHAGRKARVVELGIRTALQSDTAHYRLMQLHPADTGGSFLEIDEQVGGEAEDGPWEPAGPQWQAAKRTNVVTGIAAAEIQSPEPQRLAERWAQILQLPVNDEDGVDTITLDNAVLRFVLATDGRGEGLGAIVVSAATPDDESSHVIGGLRIDVR